jgi:hypothetical protein
MHFYLQLVGYTHQFYHTYPRKINGGNGAPLVPLPQKQPTCLAPTKSMRRCGSGIESAGFREFNVLALSFSLIT